MKRFINKLEQLMTAATFAEAGEHTEALRILGEQPKPIRLTEAFQRTMAAAAFAEADCHDMARDYLEPTRDRRRVAQPDTLDAFIRAVGLENAHFRFGLAMV